MSNYGNFKNGCEYAIHKTEIARPQLNYLWNARILSGVNHLGGGNGAYGARACAYIDPDGKGRCSVIRDGNRYFYIKNKKTGKVYNFNYTDENEVKKSVDLKLLYSLLEQGKTITLTEQPE